MNHARIHQPSVASQLSECGGAGKGDGTREKKRAETGEKDGAETEKESREGEK